jgi:hypothetical protein
MIEGLCGPLSIGPHYKSEAVRLTKLEEVFVSLFLVVRSPVPRARCRRKGGATPGAPEAKGPASRRGCAPQLVTSSQLHLDRCIASAGVDKGQARV